MGISRLTALIIQTNEVGVDTFKERDNNYGFEIGRMEHDNYRPCLTSQPVYPNEIAAREAGEKLVEDVRALDLTV
ncbi:MAG: hypothetical protein KJ600_02180 [Nanoarchaeota archaeon]|nr:hypothetical protein [Nanoarchaeota archaeon]MBU1103342.1 hypothetical protein [Nanoarchaeota archaeon]